MELLSIRTARFVAGILTAELNPRGLAIYPALIAGLVGKYNFVGFPNEGEVLDESKGIVFEDGEWNNISIDRARILDEAIVIETRSSTNDSESIFEETLQWAADSFGLTYKPEMITRKLYVSEVYFRSEKSLCSLNPALQGFGEKLTNSMKEHTNTSFNYEMSGLSFYYDSSTIKIAPAPFKIERLETAGYSENKYYSLAPLPTEVHLDLLKEFEKSLS
jgi:hypothetical protein